MSFTGACGVGVSDVYMLKSVGDRTPPCGTPFLNLRCVDVLVPKRHSLHEVGMLQTSAQNVSAQIVSTQILPPVIGVQFQLFRHRHVSQGQLYPLAGYSFKLPYQSRLVP